jgi:hypothetical protein
LTLTKERNPMEEKIIQLLVCTAHISEKMKSLSEELDKIYSILSDKEFWETIEEEE